MPKAIKYVKQSTDYSCGPTVMAMITHKTEKEIIKLLGNRFNKGLDPKDLLWGLEKLNIYCSRWIKDGLWPWSEKAILSYAYYKYLHLPEYGHYLVYYKNKFYDPYWGERKDFFHWSHARDWIKVTEYLDIYD
jgi:hypothetical protein